MADFSQSDLTNITKAIASGVQQAMIQGEMVQYRSLKEMLVIKNLIEADLASTAKPLITIATVETSRGL